MTGTAPEVLLVLIVEDEAPIADLVAAVVADAGYTPLVAAHGRQALELARARRPLLLITDLMMPQMTGAELIAALRADAVEAGQAPAPAILLTAVGPTQARVAGADAVLHKPFDLADLDALVRRFLAS